MSLTYLVLEDEPLIAMDLEFAIEDIGHEAVVAVNNAEARQAVADNTIAGAILDVSLGDGETCEPTAKLLSEHNIPFVLHTGDLDRVGEHLRALNAPVLPKPQAADDVIEKLVGMAEKA